MIDTDTFTAFSSEIVKTAKEMPFAGRAVDKALSKLTKRDVAAAGAGALTLLGGKRLVEDVRTGEQLRKQRRY